MPTVAEIEEKVIQIVSEQMSVDKAEVARKRNPTTIRLLTDPIVNAHGLPWCRIPETRPTIVMARKITSKGSRIASLITNPRPIADKMESRAGIPRQQRAVKTDPNTARFPGRVMASSLRPDTTAVMIDYALITDRAL